MNKLLATAIVGAVCLSAAPAAAVTTLNWTSAQTGLAYAVNFNGLVDGALVAGLTGRVTYTLNSVVGNAWTFGYLVENTSSAPITDSRISIFGFQITPDIVSTSSTGLFDLAVLGGNIPGLPYDAEACYKGAGGDNCSGGGGDGVTLGGSAAGTFTLNFAAATGDVTLENLFIRYQSINGPGLEDGSGVGVPTNGVIPEPATWAMMIVGFGLAGTMIRSARRRHYLAA